MRKKSTNNGTVLTSFWTKDIIKRAKEIINDCECILLRKTGFVFDEI